MTLEILFLLALPTSTAPTLMPPTAQEQEATYEERLATAGDDVAQLWEVHLWCRSKHKYSESRKTLKKIIEIDGDHKEARDALGHTFYDEQWFESSYKLSEYKRKEEKRMLEEKGLVRLGDEWVPVGDAPFLRMGWVKSDSGRWVSQRELTRLQETEQRTSEGWTQQQDGTWVSPGEAANWEKGLVKVGDEWLTAEAANEYHGKVGQEWRFPTQYFTLISTLDWGGLIQASAWIDGTYRDLVRAYGVQPPSKPYVTVMNSVPQFNGLANGDQTAMRPPTENNGYSSCHYAYIGEAWFDMREFDPNNPGGSIDYMGGGITYWDRNDENLRAFGRFAVRCAAGLSYAEAIDPSWEAISKYMTNPNPQGQMAGFWTEKAIPMWFRFGVASYVERFFEDPAPQEGFGPWWVRDWALDNIRRSGGSRPLADIFAFRLDANDQQGSAKLISEAGMVVSFVLDGGCDPVRQKHAALKHALKTGGDSVAAMAELQQAILDNEEDFHVHVGM